MSPETQAPPIHGRRNLVLLGAIAIVITIITSAIELTIYRSSGDIYLDRSRPGYLPDQKEVEEDNDTSSTYIYGDTGPLESSELQTYINELKSLKQHIDRISNPYGPEPLSDESLGITTPKTP